MIEALAILSGLLVLHVLFFAGGTGRKAPTKPPNGRRPDPPPAPPPKR